MPVSVGRRQRLGDARLGGRNGLQHRSIPGVILGLWNRHIPSAAGRIPGPLARWCIPAAIAARDFC